MDAVIDNVHPARVIFGSGTLGRLSTEVERLGWRRVLVLSTPQQERTAAPYRARPSSRRIRRTHYGVGRARMHQTDGRRALATLCIGVGQGIAIAVEAT